MRSSTPMCLRANHREKDGKQHTYGSLVETVRTADGPRQRTLCHLGELDDSAQARWLNTIEVFNDAGERHQLNRRVIVFDADTGQYKRHFGAYGNKPDDLAPTQRVFEGPGP